MKLLENSKYSKIYIFYINFSCNVEIVLYNLSMEKTKETLNERIQGLITQNGYKNLLTFHKAIVNLAGKDAVSRASLYNAIHLTTKPHEKTLHQIASVLKIHIYDLIKGTNVEPPTFGPASGYKQLNKTSVLHNLYHGLPFKPELLKVNGHGESIDEQNIFYDGTKCFRFVYIIRGTITLILKHKNRIEEQRELKKGDVFCFDSSTLHHFKNNNTQFAEIMINNFKEGSPYEE